MVEEEVEGEVGIGDVTYGPQEILILSITSAIAVSEQRFDEVLVRVGDRVGLLVEERGGEVVGRDEGPYMMESSTADLTERANMEAKEAEGNT
jgi:hypothetical protein